MANGNGRVVIIGASMAGLVTGGVLANLGSEVTILDRDTLPADAQPRKAVPQGRHAHALLQAGERVLTAMFPGLIDELVASGAQRLSWLEDARWWQFGGYRIRHGDDFQGTFMTRPLLESAIRARVGVLPNVEIHSGVRAQALVGDAGRVTGVEVHTNGGESSIVHADFVVDASGRSSQSGAWLEALGAPAPRVDQVHIDMGYASRLLRREPGHLPDCRWALTIGTPPESKRLAIIIPVEDDRWMVTLCGFFGDHAPTEDSGFLAFAESLPTDDIASVLRTAEPLTPIVTHRLASEQWRRFEKVHRPPAGFATIGDGICSFNPIYGQGMSSAALQAVALGHCVQEHAYRSPALPRRFYRSAAKIVAPAWQVAAGGDFFYRETTGPKPVMVHRINGYIRKAVIASQHDPVVASAVSKVQNLLAPPPSLMRPAIIRRVRRAAHSPSDPTRVTPRPPARTGC